MKKTKKIFIILIPIILAFATKNLSATKTYQPDNLAEQTYKTCESPKYKAQKTSKSQTEKEQPSCPTYILKKNSKEKIYNYVNRKNLEENTIYMEITNINHNLNIISESPIYLKENEPDKIRIQFNNCTHEEKEKILEFIKAKNYYLKSFYSPDEKLLLVNLNLIYCKHYVHKLKDTFNEISPKLFTGKNLKIEILEKVCQIVYNKKTKKFNVLFGNIHGDLLFKISRHFYEKDYKVWCKKESKYMSVAYESPTTYDKIKEELNKYFETHPIFACSADKIAEF